MNIVYTELLTIFKEVGDDIVMFIATLATLLPSLIT